MRKVWKNILKVLTVILRWIKPVVFAIGIFASILITFAFTRIPYELLRVLGDTGTAYNFTPEYLVFLGGSGMPSESNLMRLYYIQHLAVEYPQSKIILVHPNDSVTVNEMKNYLIQTGVYYERILRMQEGHNTRAQAIALEKHFVGISKKKIVLVTSPENMYRSIRVFRKLGFDYIGGISAYENAMYINLEYNYKKLGGKEFVPDVSSLIDIRYNFWNYLKLEITCLREITAILYYKVNGWI